MEQRSHKQWKLIGGKIRIMNDLEQLAKEWKERREIIYKSSVRNGLILGLISLIPLFIFRGIWLPIIGEKIPTDDTVLPVLFGVVIGLTLFLITSFILQIIVPNPCKGLSHREKVDLLKKVGVIGEGMANKMRN